MAFGDVLTSFNKTSKITYDLAKLLSIKPKDLSKVLRKGVGESFKKGDILAKKSGFISAKEVVVPFDGKVVDVDSEKAILTVEPLQVDHDKTIAPVSGTVKKVNQDEIILEFGGTVVFAKQGIGNLKKGVLVVISKEDEEVPLGNITSEHIGKILLGGRFVKNVLEKAYGLGVVSVIATSFDDGEFAYFEQKSIFNASLILVSKADYEILSKFAGKDIVVEGKHKRIIIND